VALVVVMSNDRLSNELFLDRHNDVTISLNIYVVTVKFLTLKGVIGKVGGCNTGLRIVRSLRFVSSAKCAEEGNNNNNNNNNNNSRCCFDIVDRAVNILFMHILGGVYSVKRTH
jgi:hypothetical protein